MQVKQLVVARLLTVFLKVATDVLHSLSLGLIHADVPVDDLVEHARRLELVAVYVFLRLFFIVELVDVVVKLVDRLDDLVLEQFPCRRSYPPVGLEALLDELLHLVADILPGHLVEGEVDWVALVDIGEVTCEEEVECDA